MFLPLNGVVVQFIADCKDVLLACKGEREDGKHLECPDWARGQVPCFSLTFASGPAAVASGPAAAAAAAAVAAVPQACVIPMLVAVCAVPVVACK